METVTLNIQVNLQELAKLLSCMPERREDSMVRQYGEVCSISEASKILGVSPRTVYTMVRDGRLETACDGTRVDVRSIASYIEGDRRKRRVVQLRV